MRKLRYMVLLLSIMLVSSFFASAEGTFFEELYSKLPDSPTPQQAEEAYDKLLSHAKLKQDLPDDLDIKLLLGVLSIEISDDFYRSEITPPKMSTRESVDRGVKPRPPKRMILRLMIARMLMEAEVAPGVSPDVYMRNLYVLEIVRNIKREMAIYESRLKDVQECLQQTISALEEKHKVQQWRDQLVETELEQIDVEGETPVAKFESWKRKISQPDISKTRFAAMWLWFWRYFDREKLLLPNAVENFSIYADDSLKYVWEHLFVEWILPPEDAWRKNDSGQTNEYLRKPEAFYLTTLRRITDDILKEHCKYPLKALQVCIPGFVGRAAFPGSEREANSLTHSEIENYIYSAWVERYLKVRRKYARKEHKNPLVEERRGKGGPAWFMGASDFAGESGTLQVSRDFVYPICTFTCEPRWLPCLASYKSSEGFLGGTMMQTPWFEDTKSDSYEETERVAFYDFSKPLTVDYDYTLEGLESLFTTGWKERFFAGLPGFSPKGHTTQRVKELFKPAVFYHFSQTEWVVYSVHDYDAISDLNFFKRQFTFLAIYPSPDQQPDDVLAGLYLGGLDNWVFRSGVKAGSYQVWNAAEFLKSPASKEAREVALEIAVENAENCAEKWDAGRAKVDKMHEEYYGPRRIPKKTEDQE